MPKNPSATKHQFQSDARNKKLHIAGTFAGVPYAVTIDVGNGTAAWDPKVKWREVSGAIPDGTESTEGCAGCGSVIKKLIKGGLGWAKELLNMDQVAPDVAAARKALCLLCPSKCYDFGICRDDLPNRTAYQQGCGCILAMKVTQASEECPHRHWGRVDGKS